MPDFQSTLPELAKKKIWVLDFDGLMYPVDSLFSADFYERIANNFNAITTENQRVLQKFYKALSGFEGIKNVNRITPADLKLTYVPIVKALIETAGDEYPAELMDQLYGGGHEIIRPDANLVEAFKIARAKGIEIYFNTNSPSGKEPGVELHVQHAMRALGFDEETIDYMRPRTYDIVDAVKAGRQKDDVASFEKDFLPRMGIKEPTQALMGDDKLANLLAAYDAGLSTLWTWTSTQNPKAEDVESAERILAPRVLDTGIALLQIAEAYKPAA